jgi:hypothetical protein
MGFKISLCPPWLGLSLKWLDMKGRVVYYEHKNKEGIMKVTVEVPRKILYAALIVLLIAVLSIPAAIFFRPQPLKAEWNSDNTSTSDSYVLDTIEDHLDDIVDQFEKLNYNLSNLEYELEQIRNELD